MSRLEMTRFRRIGLAVGLGVGFAGLLAAAKPASDFRFRDRTTQLESRLGR